MEIEKITLEDKYNDGELVIVSGVEEGEEEEEVLRKEQDGEDSEDEEPEEENKCYKCDDPNCYRNLKV